MTLTTKTITAVIALLGICPCLQAQTLSPEQWETFIATNNTTLVSDTFRMQRFENALPDNWEYTPEGTCTVIEAKSTGLAKTSGGKLLKLNLGSIVRFRTTVSSFHQAIRGGLGYISKNLVAGEHLDVTLYHGDSITDARVSKVNGTYSADLKHVDIVNRDRLYGIDLKVAKVASGSKGGYYAVDSIYLFGDIPAYSLFRGKGNWNDTTAWSHLPAERHRHALIKGEIAASADIHCDKVSLSGKLAIRQDKTFSANNLSLFEATSVIKNEGTLRINGTISLTRTFQEKGVWYPVSFPFDVYADGIDPAFTHTDDTPNSGGNFIYILSYNGEKRSKEREAESSWEVVSPAASGAPLFEKNKGYLIAIDEKATATCLSFTSRAGSIPPDFGKSGDIRIAIPYTAEGNRHDGWQFCGNPLPSPLHVSRLAHPNLDNYVYVYNGEDYTAIPMDGNYVLAPWSAFFLKARQSTDLTVGEADEIPGSAALASMQPFRTSITEPPSAAATGNELADNTFLISATESAIHIDKTPDKGDLAIFDVTGYRVFTYAFSAGESLRIPKPERQGVYFLCIQTRNGRTVYKFIR